MLDALAVRRIHIVGGPGSGESTLAQELGERLALPVYDLDTVAYEGGAGPKRSLAARHADVVRIAQDAGWITEGIYLWWCEPLAARADRVIWIDVPWSVAVYRIVRRHIKASLAGTNRHPGLVKLGRFAWSTRRYYLQPLAEAHEPIGDDDDGAITRSHTASWLEPYRDKVIRCWSGNDMKNIVTAVSGQS